MKLYTGQQNLKIEPDSSPPDIFFNYLTVGKKNEIKLKIETDSSPPDIFFNYFTVGEKKSTDEENLVDGGDIKTI